MMPDPYWRGVAQAEALNEALADWQQAHGDRRRAYRRYAMKLTQQMRAERDAGRAKLREAAACTQSNGAVAA